MKQKLTKGKINMKIKNFIIKVLFCGEEKLIYVKANSGTIGVGTSSETKVVILSYEYMPDINTFPKIFSGIIIAAETDLFKKTKKYKDYCFKCKNFSICTTIINKEKREIIKNIIVQAFNKQQCDKLKHNLNKNHKILKNEILEYIEIEGD